MTGDHARSHLFLNNRQSGASMRVLKTGTQSGFTLIELLIVLVVAGILTTIAVLNFRGAKIDLQRQSIARELKIYLERARFDSVKRRAASSADQAYLVFTSARSFTAHIDFDEDRVLRSNEARVVDFSQRAQTQIIVSDVGLNYPITVSFDQRGQARATDGLGNTVSPMMFTICSSSNCGTNSPDRTVISLSPSGTVAVLRNGQSPQVNPTPVITNTTPLINCYVLVSNSNTACHL
jgi:prepilin-type N-terminal cleavage/methylation domain-containing protein